jgi:hypothetical protein
MPVTPTIRTRTFLLLTAALWIVARASVVRADPAAIMGGDIGVSRTPQQVATELNSIQAAGIHMARVSLVPDTYYAKSAPSLGDMDDVVLACHKHGITPVLEFEFYQFWIPFGWFNARPLKDYDWKAIGHLFAARYAPGSAWLKSQSITNWGVTVYTAINEPDNYLNGGHIPLQDYFDAIKNFAQGIHSAGAALKVVPGGFARPCSYMDYTTGGYATILAPLFNDGTLDGIDIHTYNGDWTPMKWDFTAQNNFERVKTACGITRDINYYCTEFNYTSDKHPDADEWAKNFLSCMWNQLTITNTAGQRKVQLAFPFKLNSIKSKQWPFGMSTQLDPWEPDTRGKTLRDVVTLTNGMEFVRCQQGLFELHRDGATLWVLQNRTGWRSGHVSTSLTLKKIPAGMKSLQIWDGLSKTIELAGQTSYTVTDLRTEETAMILATAK